VQGGQNLRFYKNLRTDGARSETVLEKSAVEEGDDRAGVLNGARPIEKSGRRCISPAPKNQFESNLKKQKRK
jgi:hypothetical protein